MNYADGYEERVTETANFLKDYLTESPQFGVTLGSGLGDLASYIAATAELPYKDIPNFP